MKALIFDMDGLMIDSERLYFQCQYEIAALFNKKINDKMLWKLMGRKPLDSIRIFLEDTGIQRDPQEIFELRNSMMRDKLRNDLIPMKGLFNIVEEFSSLLSLGIATGAQQEFLDIVVDKLNMRDKFNLLLASDQIKKGKPDPEIYLKACDMLGCKPSEAYVLEDSANGINAAFSAGCRPVAVPSEYTEAQDFSNALFIASDLNDAALLIREDMSR